MQRQENFGDNEELKLAQKAAIEFLQKENCDKRDTEIEKVQCYKAFGLENKTDGPHTNWGIYTYFYNDGRCDYLASNSLNEGQELYRQHKDDKAKIFIANGNVQRQKGDQIDIEICTGKALQDGNLKMKLYENDTFYVVNHETNTIYNDVVHFHQYRLNEALKSYEGFPQQDATILVRGSDGLIIKKKGDDQYIQQNLAYLYNDFES